MYDEGFRSSLGRHTQKKKKKVVEGRGGSWVFRTLYLLDVPDDLFWLPTYPTGRRREFTEGSLMILLNQDSDGGGPST